jgi:uncharacterized membrane-anchored protein YitT (DUF2179 family)
MKKINFRKELKTFAIVVFGTATIGIGIMYFLNPAGLYTGGVSGLAQLIVNTVFAASQGEMQINLGLLSFLFQVPLLVFGYFKLNKRFIVYTVISVVVLSVVLSLSPFFIIIPADPLGSAIAGGLLTGFGNGILYKVGASSGGTSIVFQHLSIKTGKSVGAYQILFNGIVILIAGIQFNLGVAVYTILSQLIVSLVIDRIHTSYNFVKLEIITTLGDEMADALAHRLPHGVTYLDAIGAYTHTEKKIIYAVISVHELHQYQELIEQIDPKAFVIINGVDKVLGNFKKKIMN